MRITIAICLVGLTVGCSKKDDKASPATDKVADPAKPDKPSVKPVLEMFTGSKVTLPPMFADAKLGGPIDKLKADLDKKWGASRAGQMAGKSFYWADPDAQVRVKATDNLGGSELDFE